MTSGEMIGHYRIVESLGAGAMGTVRIAVDTYIDRPVAIKSLRPELTSDPDFVSRFRGEAKSLARLNHPNIATLFSPIIDGSDMHLVMELVRGKTLDEILRRRGRPVGVREALAIVAQAADGLSYAHEMGVIHRDIKPANLMIADDGRVKIMDFGIARVQGSVRLTRSGTAVGTPLYMSPEQCRGGEGDERSDIYSLAIVLYELLGGAPPFTAETEYDLIQAQITTTPAPLVPRVAGVSPTLEAAILKALAKKPERRFETMRAFSDALGATALRPDATGMIRNATHLIEAKEEPAQAPARTGAFDVVKSRLLGFSRGWTALGGGSKAGIAAGVLALLAGGAYLAKPDGDGTSAPALSSPIGRALTLSDLRLAVAGSAAEAIRAGDFDLVSNGIKTQLLEPVRKLADAGNAEAQFVQGMLLSETPGHIDRQKAFAAFTQSANQNYAEAQAVLGSLYQDGQTPEGRNLQKAAEWYERAAERGNGKAAFWLGCYDQFGWGGRSVNPQKAIADYSKAIAGHYPKATEALQAMSGGGGARSPCK